MALTGWLLDKSAAARAGQPATRRHLQELVGSLYLCPVGEPEQLCSARSARDYDALKAASHESFEVLVPPGDVFDRARALLEDLAHHHGMWPRPPFTTAWASSTSTATMSGSPRVRPLRIRRLQ